MKTLHVDLSQWGQISVTGDDRKRFLHGMCTSNIEKLEEGGWLRSAILNVKGRLISIVEIAHRGDDHLLLCQPDLRDATIAYLEQYAMVDDVEFAAVEEPLHKVWSDPQAVWDSPPLPGPAPEPAASEAEIEVRRVEAGLPRYGVDVTEKNFPFETPLDRHIDYQKGCYIGQEPVARVKSRGTASKYLRGLRVEGEGPAPAGASVDHAEKAAISRVSSAVVSPAFGSIALALLPRMAWDAGTRVTIEGRAAEVVELPFGTESSC
jgi:tRNA-modifying protein YgfZ